MNIKSLYRLGLGMLVLLGAYLNVAAATKCDQKLLTEAEKLMTLHKGKDPNLAIEHQFKQLPSVKSLYTKKKYKVSEVWAHIDKTRYRMRFIYEISNDGYCAIMGEEILEF